MNMIYILIAGLIIVGVALTSYERRRAKTLADRPSTYDAAQLAKDNSEHARRTNPAGMHGGMNGPHSGY